MVAVVGARIPVSGDGAMNSKINWHLGRHLRKVWVRVVAFAVLAVLTIAVAQLVAPFIPAAWTISIGAEAVDQILDVLAASMLTVTTFSLAIAISAFAAAASTATPRATALLQEDSTAQNVLATFLGAFLFSLVGIIALQGGYYSSSGRLVRILSGWTDRSEVEVEYEAVFVPPISTADMIEDAFRPIAGDGAALAEVRIRLQKALDALSTIPPVFADAAAAMAADARSRARESLTKRDYRQLEALCAEISARGPSEKAEKAEKAG